MDEETRKRKDKCLARGAMVSNYGKPRKPYPREKVQKNKGTKKCRENEKCRDLNRPMQFNRAEYRMIRAMIGAKCYL